MDLNFPRSTLRDYLRVVFRHKAVIITTIITVVISSAFWLEYNTPVYSAHVKMLVSAEKRIDSPYYKVLNIGGEISLSHCTIVNSDPVIARAVKALKLHERPIDYEKNYCSSFKIFLMDLGDKISKSKSTSSKVDSQYYKIPDDSPRVGISLSKTEIVNPNLGSEEEQPARFREAVEGLKQNINANPIMDTNLFVISAKDFNPIAAAMIANVVSRSYVVFDLEQQLSELQMQYGEKHPTVVQLKNNIDTMTKNLNGKPLSDMEAFGPGSVKIIEQAQVPPYPIGYSKRSIMVLAFFVSSFLGIILAFVFENVDQTFRSPRDIENFLNLPLLGSIPKKEFKNKRLFSDAKRINPYNQFYRDLSDQIYLLMKDKNLKSFLITAYSALEGSTNVVMNLCEYLSNKVCYRVVVIDANLKTPTIHKFFNISDKTGLTDVLEGRISFDKAIQHLNSYLTVLPAGNLSLSPILHLDSTSISNVIEIAKEKHDIVIIDYASLRNLRDARVLCSHVDGIVVVVNEGKTRRHAIKTIIETLDHTKVNLAGVIMNNRTFPIPKFIYERV